MRTPKARDPVPGMGPWLELDRVRTVLSCIILAGLLALIIIGGRKSTALHESPTSQYGSFDESLLVAHSDGER